MKVDLPSVSIPHAAAVAEQDWANQTDPPTTVAGGIEVEYARISHVISTALHNGDARPCHKQARAVLDTHRDCSAKRSRANTPLPEARAHYRYRALTLILHPDRTAPELLRHRTMARLVWDAVQTARAYLEHTGQVDELFPLEQRRLAPYHALLQRALAPGPSCGLSRLLS